MSIDAARRLFSERSRWRPTEIIFWVSIIACYFLFPGYLVLLSQLLIAGALVLSLDLLLGYTGIVSLGQGAFFGIGAYTAAIVARAGWTEPFSCLLVSGFAAALVGSLCGLMVARLTGVALLTVTLAICMLFYEAANRLSFITGGENGLSDIPVAKVLGVFEWDINGSTAFFYSAAVVLLLYLLARHIVHSPFGLSLQGIRENIRRVPALGISVHRRVVASFTISAAFAGVAGALLAQTTQSVSLEVLSFERSVSALIMLAMGGMGSLIGGMLGAAVYTVTRDILANLNPIYWNFWLGLILVAAVLLGTGGLVGGLNRVRNRVAIWLERP